MGVRTSMQLHARVLRYARPEWRALVAVLALSAAAGVLAPLQPWPLKLLVDHAIGTRPPPAWLAGALDALGIAPGRPALLAVAAAAGIAVFALHATLDAVLTLAWARASQRMVLRLAGELFLQLQRLSLTFHARRPLGDSLSRLTTDAWCVQTVADGLVVVPLRQGMVLLATGVLAWQLDPGLTGLVLVGVPVLAASAMHFGRRLQHAERRKRESGARLAAFVHQVVGAMPLVQSFAAGPRNRRLYDALARESVQAARHGTLVGSAFTLVNGMATTLGIALVVYAGGLKVLDHAMALGSLLVFVAYVRTLDQATRALLKAYGSLRGAAAVAQRVTEVLDAPERVPEPAVPQPLPDRRAGCTGQLRFEGIVAGHVAGQPVLHGADLVVAPGETVALVGGSGAGKTTLVSLVPRFLDPWSGRVLLDGVDVRALALADLRAEVGVVLQDPFLLPISIADNIAYGRPDARREAIVEAARAADAHDFIAALPQGYDTVLGEQGGALSGGQRQRLAIARALLRDPRVLILDEPTSALDAGTERQVMDGLARLAAGRTTLIVAHRLATVRLADRIAVLDAGRVVEVGTHAELLARGGRYAQLHALGAGDALREAVA